MDSIKNTKVIVIGGVGQMGRHVCRLLSRLDGISRIDVADIAHHRADLLATELGPKGNAVTLDATDVDALGRAFSDVDFVVNTLGPFNYFALPILNAAIDAGIDYVDVCDDWEATNELLKLDEKARENGVRAVIGVGMSPGLTNLLAMRAAEELDDVDQIITGWPLTGARVEVEQEYDADRSSSAALEHWILQCSGTINVFTDGEFSEVEPLQKMEIDYPGVGTQTARTLGHPEPITLPMTFPHLRESVNVMTGANWVFDLLTEATQRFDNGEISLKEAAALVADMRRPRGVPREPRDEMPTAWAQVTGVKDRKQRRVSAHLSAWPPHFMGGATGYPAAIGVDLIARNPDLKPGVMAPEKAFEPSQFFDALSNHVEGSPVDDYLVVSSVHV